ncbi:serrate RNA effector molecule-like protein [Gossypium australe]|uniref:Serrate RNA effector molecule-like protein n=1 Tax=Gossypium australe TaxID=47621 RepID=A0A5B6W9P3_9ROSI|nr:serrate RNA effector molecule-like protein [Gossypium australe]
MPSGAKKRKAAKKKKEQAANNINPSTNNNLLERIGEFVVCILVWNCYGVYLMVLGNDDPRSQDERDSDGGDAGSPASHDGHNHQHSFGQGGDEERSQSHVTEEKPVEEAAKDAKSTERSGLDDADVKIVKEWEPNKDLECTHVSIQHVDHDKSSSSSSNSSSDDESQAFEKKSNEETSYSTEDKSAAVLSEEVLKVAENNTLENVDSNSAVETVAVDNLVKNMSSVAEEVEFAAKNSVPDVVESGLKENEEKLLPSSNGISGVELGGVEGKNFPSSGIPTAETSDVAEKNHASGPHGYPEKQPLVAPTPPPVQRTSWLSCCGLFEVFTGSGR